MRVLILILYVALIAWIAVAGSLVTGLTMAAASAVLAFAFRPMTAAQAVTGWARASLAERGV
jgi:hypothetical protein